MDWIKFNKDDSSTYPKTETDVLVSLNTGYDVFELVERSPEDKESDDDFFWFGLGVWVELEDVEYWSYIKPPIEETHGTG